MKARRASQQKRVKKVSANQKPDFDFHRHHKNQTKTKTFATARAKALVNVHR